MRITEDCINHNVVRLIKGNSLPWEMYEQNDDSDHQRLIALGYIDGVLAMADCMKELQKA